MSSEVEEEWVEKTTTTTTTEDCNKKRNDTKSKKKKSGKSKKHKKERKKEKKSSIKLKRKERKDDSAEDEEALNSNSSSDDEEEILRKKHKKSKRKHKKYKNKHKKNKRSSSSDSHSSSSSSASVDQVKNCESESVNASVKSAMKREDWLTMQPSSFLTKSTTNEEKRTKRRQEKEEERLKNTYNPKENARELNPYWKNGGNGLPTNFLKPPNSNEENSQQTKFAKNRSTGFEKKTGQGWRKNNKQAHEEKQRNREQEKAQENTPNTQINIKNTQINIKDTQINIKEDKHGLIYENINIRSSEDTKNVNKKEEEGEKSVEEEEEKDVKFDLTEKQMNGLAAKLLKAEIMGNETLANKLRTRLDLARKQQGSRSRRRNEEDDSNSVEENVILTKSGSFLTKPLSLPKNFLSRRQEVEDPWGGRCKKSKKNRVANTHDKLTGERTKYFADDDDEASSSLKEMFEREKFNTISDSNSEFAQLIGGSKKKLSKNDDLEDVFVDNARKQESVEKLNKRNYDKAVNEHKTLMRVLENCDKCVQSKNLVIHSGETMRISLPEYEPLTSLHCLITPLRHVNCSTMLDENEWQELIDLRKTLVKIFNTYKCKSQSDEHQNQNKNEDEDENKDENVYENEDEDDSMENQGLDVIFFESASSSLRKNQHMIWHCVPIPKSQLHLAPSIYFKKAIEESEQEWSLNKKLVDLKGKDVRKCVPKGLPYFCVSFGMQEGFAHVIEDERYFPSNFAQEIIGGMLDLPHDKWRKPKTQSFNQQKERVLKFNSLFWKKQKNVI